MATTSIWAVAVIIAVLPIGLEVVSIIPGGHLWTFETVEYAIVPLVSLAVSWMLSSAIPRSHSIRGAVIRAVMSIALLVGCVPPVYLFGSLIAQQIAAAHAA